MSVINLDGKWVLDFQGKKYDATVPGLDVLDLMANGEVPDPNEVENDEVFFFISESDKTYSKTFNLSSEDLKQDIIEISFKRLDTLASIKVNGKNVAKTNNIHLSYCFNIKDYVVEGENLVEVTFESLRKYIDKEQKVLKLPYNAMGTTGHPHIRKCACHFGWDFAPELCPQGISDHCEVRARSLPYIDFLKVSQKLNGNNGVINGSVEMSEKAECGNVEITLTYPNGNTDSVTIDPAKEIEFTFDVEDAEIWWCNGLGEQPLYTVTATYNCDNEVISTKSKRIGFRDIKLDRSDDKYGTNFQFVVNGKGIFARGANYIPLDSLYTRLTREKIYNLLLECKKANMNMVRVWGGGFYESDDFYDICDELGILLWQDFGFACCAYPFMQKDFLDNVLEEVKYNTKRLMHHACLALWCGNNEIESIQPAWIYRTDFIKTTGEFFYHTLPETIKEFDSVTPYHATSPSSGKYMKLPNSDAHGDTHIWNVWHGYRFKEYFKTRFTRFASEYGMQSYPNDGIMPHQKCDLGEERLNYYLASLLTTPSNLKDKRYLTQIIQLASMREAGEHFRRHSYRCHGALYWQLNDCWSSASWAGIDYKLGKKAVMYAAKHFNENIHISADSDKKQIEIYISNDQLDAFNGKIVLEKVNTLTGKTTLLISKNVNVESLTSSCVATVDMNSISKTHNVLTMKAYDADDNLVSENREIFCKDNELELKQANIDCKLIEKDGKKYIEVKADNYARYVLIDVLGTNLEDNYFDLSKDECKVVEVEGELNTDEINAFSLYDVLKSADKKADKKIARQENLKPMAIANRVSRYFDL